MCNEWLWKTLMTNEFKLNSWNKSVGDGSSFSIIISQVLNTFFIYSIAWKDISLQYAFHYGRNVELLDHVHIYHLQVCLFHPKSYNYQIWWVNFSSPEHIFSQQKILQLCVKMRKSWPRNAELHCLLISYLIYLVFSTHLSVNGRTGCEIVLIWKTTFLDEYGAKVKWRKLPSLLKQPAFRNTFGMDPKLY